MNLDIRDQIEQSFGDGPPADDAAELIAHGRAAVRRRRLLEGASLVVVAGVVVAAALLSSGGTTGSTSPDPAGSPRATQAAEPRTPTPTPTPLTVPPPVPGGTRPDVALVEDRTLSPDAPVSVQLDGTVGVRPGVRVVRTIARPFDREDLTSSAALEYTWRGTTYWYVGYVTEDGGSSANQPVLDTMSFRDWIREQRPIQGSAGTDAVPDAEGDWPGRVDLQLVRFAGAGERLSALGAATLLDQRAHPDLPESWATATDRSAVAEVRFEGRRYYVLARRTPGTDPEYIAVDAAKGGATLDDFLQFARARYAEGGGGLL